MPKNTPAKIRANNRYTAKAYDRITLLVPKGHRATVQALAEAQGESVNSFINGLLRAAAGLSEEEWKEAEKKEEVHETD